MMIFPIPGHVILLGKRSNAFDRSVSNSTYLPLWASPSVDFSLIATRQLYR